MLFTLVSAALLLPWCFGQTSTPDLNNVTTAFSSAHIVPDVVQSFNPMDGVNISFTDPVSAQTVDVVPGILLTMQQTSMPPDLTLVTTTSDSNSSAMFVVVIVDPDAPTPQNPNVSEFLHFLGGDFTAGSTSGLLSNNSPALAEFFPPTPPVGSDPHRYVLLVFDQPDSFDVNGPTLVNATTPRTNFSISDFAQAINLGDAIAGNFFLVGPMNASASATPSAPPSTPSIPLASSPTSGDTLASPTPTSSATSPNTSPSSKAMKARSAISPFTAAIVGVAALVFQL
ncbi:OV-16 antigen [Psilocybe cubensis]|uniref:OV-16 antigen n=2 Tax=Psilocybe cubensis TaxID=181762 RepID=A0ACB8H5K0_PSICU|nr:OV-16 antigen [Psilocybe cubensis]KAH9482771.1 OV-16 antigen [Psilocybe cubensis]